MLNISWVQCSTPESHICGSDYLFYHTTNCLLCEGSKSPLIGPHIQHVLWDCNSNPSKPPLWLHIELKGKQKPSIHRCAQKITWPLSNESCPYVQPLNMLPLNMARLFLIYETYLTTKLFFSPLYTAWNDVVHDGKQIMIMISIWGVMKLSPFAFLFPSALRHLSMTIMDRNTAVGFLPHHAEGAGHYIVVKSDRQSHKHWTGSCVQPDY